MPEQENNEPKEYLKPSERIALYGVLVAVASIVVGGIPWGCAMAAKAGQIQSDVTRHDAKLNEMSSMSDRLARIETKLDMMREERKNGR